jgi:hypothetical protein
MTEPRRRALSDAMAIYKLIQNTAFEKDIERLVMAYEQTLRALRLKALLPFMAPALFRHGVRAW